MKRFKLLLLCIFSGAYCSAQTAANTSDLYQVCLQKLDSINVANKTEHVLVLRNDLVYSIDSPKLKTIELITDSEIRVRTRKHDIDVLKFDNIQLEKDQLVLKYTRHTVKRKGKWTSWSSHRESKPQFIFSYDTEAKLFKFSRIVEFILL